MNATFIIVSKRNFVAEEELFIVLVTVELDKVPNGLKALRSSHCYLSAEMNAARFTSFPTMAKSILSEDDFFFSHFSLLALNCFALHYLLPTVRSYL